MASTWAASLPYVTVGETEAKPVTFVYPFYQCHKFFARQLAVWSAYPAELRQHLSVIVVDDGSPEPATLPSASPFSLRLFRIGIDLPWNWLAARNIGAHYAPDGWMLLTDMDHVVPVETVARLIHGQHDPRVVYVFQRQEHTGAMVPPHSASFFLTRELFWAIGGYDEELSGRYGTDGEFRRRIRAHAQIQVLTDVLIRHEFVEDSSTTRYRRKDPADAMAVKRIVSSRVPGWTPRTLSFPYSEVTA